MCQFSKKLQSDPVLIRPKLASVLISAHLWHQCYLQLFVLCWLIQLMFLCICVVCAAVHRPVVRFQALGGKLFKGAKFLFLLCLKQIFLGTTKFGGLCFRMPSRVYGPGCTEDSEPCMNPSALCQSLSLHNPAFSRQNAMQKHYTRTKHWDASATCRKLSSFLRSCHACLRWLLIQSTTKFRWGQTIVEPIIFIKKANVHILRSSNTVKEQNYAANNI